jgi:hypothetical protein
MGDSGDALASRVVKVLPAQAEAMYNQCVRVHWSVASRPRQLIRGCCYSGLIEDRGMTLAMPSCFRRCPVAADRGALPKATGH